MAGNFTRYMIDKLVDRALHEMKQGSKRELRNIVELGLFHSRGGFQSEFFRMLHQMLIDQRSPYYDLALTAAANVAAPVLKKFGINLGYNAWTAGARCIREYQRRTGCGVPWAIVFDLTGAADQPLTAEEISRVVSQAREMGVYSFFLLCGQDGERATWSKQLLHSFPDCVFFLFVAPEKIDAAACAVFAAAGNAMPVIAYTRQGKAAYQSAAALLRGKHCLYGAWLRYETADIQRLIDDYAAAGPDLPPATFLLRGAACAEEDAAQVHALVEHTRLQPGYPTFLINFYQDIARVGSIISAEPRFLEIANDGGVRLQSGRTAVASIRGQGLALLLQQLTPAFSVV